MMRGSWSEVHAGDRVGTIHSKMCNIGSSEGSQLRNIMKNQYFLVKCCCWWWTPDERLIAASLPIMGHYVSHIAIGQQVLSKYLPKASTRFLEQSNRAKTIELGPIAPFARNVHHFKEI